MSLKKGKTSLLVVVAAAMLIPVAAWANPFLTDQDSKSVQARKVRPDEAGLEQAAKSMNGDVPVQSGAKRPAAEDGEGDKMVFVGQYNDVLLFRTSSGVKTVRISNDSPAKIGEVKIADGTGDMFFKYKSRDDVITRDEVDGFYRPGNVGERLNIVNWTDKAEPCPRKLAYQVSEFGSGLWWICADVTMIAVNEGGDMPLPWHDIQKQERAKAAERRLEEERRTAAYGEAMAIEAEAMDRFRRDKAMAGMAGDGPVMQTAEGTPMAEAIAMQVISDMGSLSKGATLYRYKAKKWPDRLADMTNMSVGAMDSIPAVPSGLHPGSVYEIDKSSYSAMGNPDRPDVIIVLRNVPEDVCEAVDRHSGQGNGTYATVVDGVADIDIQCVGRDLGGVGRPTSYDIIKKLGE